MTQIDRISGRIRSNVNFQHFTPRKFEQKEEDAKQIVRDEIIGCKYGIIIIRIIKILTDTGGRRHPSRGFSDETCH